MASRGEMASATSSGSGASTSSRREVSRRGGSWRNIGTFHLAAGDYNVVPTPQDIYPTRSLDNNALIQPESRAAHARLLNQGWTDALRTIQPEGPLWTFWDYKFHRWEADKGMRLDHLLLSPAIAPNLTAAGVDRHVRGEPNASDHAPAWITLDTKARR